MMTQEVMIEQLLPVQRPPEGAPHKLVSTVYELPPAETLAQVLPDFRGRQALQRRCATAFASEVAARRSAMDSATKNAGEMISDLKLQIQPGPSGRHHPGDHGNRGWRGSTDASGKEFLPS